MIIHLLMQTHEIGKLCRNPLSVKGIPIFLWLLLLFVMRCKLVGIPNGVVYVVSQEKHTILTADELTRIYGWC